MKESLGYNKTTLDNGVRVVSRAMPHLATAALGVWLDAGARLENRVSNGVAHMLEHMAFKGTRRRNAKQIAEEIENVGGQLNAYTSREQTAYYARVLADDVPLALDLIADILRHSVFAADELERERTVILQEISQVHDTPDDLVFDLFQEQAFPDQPLGWSILGPVANVRAMRRDQLTGFMDANYSPERLVVAAAGKVEHRALVDFAGHAFSDMAKVDRAKPERAAYRGGAKLEPRDLEQVHILVGLPGIPVDDPDFYALQVLSTALGCGMSSRLFQEVREKRGLAYSVFSFSSSYSDCGLFGMYVGTGAGESAEVLPVLCHELHDVTLEIGSDELDRASSQLKASLMMSLENCHTVCEDIARQEVIFGEWWTPEQVIEKIDAVDKEAIERVGRRLIEGVEPTLCAIGPTHRIPELGKLQDELRL